MYAVARDLKLVLQQLIAEPDPVATEDLVVIEEHPDYPGELVFQTLGNPNAFYSRYRGWVSHYLVLSELFNLDSFITQLNHDGWHPVFGGSAEAILADLQRWREPLAVEGYDLHPFQQFSLRRAFETDFFFFNWATGAGKSFIAAVGAAELFRRDEVDLVIAATVSKSKENLRRFFAKAGLDAVVNDGTKAKRLRGYYEGHQVYVCNYEKLWVDNEAITDLTHGLRVLFVFDECHKIITDGKPNNARKAFDRLVHLTRPRVWPMSASVVNGNPLRFRDVFSLAHEHPHPLGSRGDFERRYANEVKTIPIKHANGRRFDLTVYDWNLNRLHEIRHRVSHTHAVRKTDPGVAQYFKGMATIVVAIQASREESRLTEFITDRAWEAYQREENMAPYYHLLRTVANIPTALMKTESAVVKELIRDEHWDLDKLMVAAGNGTKIEVLNEQLESIRDAGDKVLVFTHWTNLTLHLIEPLITVPHVTHFGTGQTNKESQAAQDRFQDDPDLTCFLTSDAGEHGLNMTAARYVIQFDPTYSYDDGMQRASRIDRSDSHLDGLTNYVYVTEGSVEERVWSINNARRIISAAVQGTEESISYGDAERERALRSEAENMAFLLFGDRM